MVVNVHSISIIVTPDSGNVFSDESREKFEDEVANKLENQLAEVDFNGYDYRVDIYPEDGDSIRGWEESILLIASKTLVEVSE